MAYTPAAILLLMTLAGAVTEPQICHQPAAQPRPDSAQYAFDNLTAALNSRNLDEALASMTPDLLLSYAGVDDLKRPFLDESFRKRLAAESTRKIRTEIQEVCESGDLAVFRVIWVVDYTEADGQVRTTRERDMEVWRRDSGRWRLARGMSLPHTTPR